MYNLIPIGFHEHQNDPHKERIIAVKVTQTHTGRGALQVFVSQWILNFKMQPVIRNGNIDIDKPIGIVFFFNYT